MKNFKRFLVVALMGGILMTSSISLAANPGKQGGGSGKTYPKGLPENQVCPICNNSGGTCPTCNPKTYPIGLPRNQ